MTSLSERMRCTMSITSNTRVSSEELQMRAEIASPWLKMLTTDISILRKKKNKLLHSNNILSVRFIFFVFPLHLAVLVENGIISAKYHPNKCNHYHDEERNSCIEPRTDRQTDKGGCAVICKHLNPHQRCGTPCLGAKAPESTNNLRYLY